MSKLKPSELREAVGLKIVKAGLFLAASAIGFTLLGSQIEWLSRIMESLTSDELAVNIVFLIVALLCVNIYLVIHMYLIAAESRTPNKEDSLPKSILIKVRNFRWFVFLLSIVIGFISANLADNNLTRLLSILLVSIISYKFSYFSGFSMAGQYLEGDSEIETVISDYSKKFPWK